MTYLLFIALGGATGALSRHFLTAWVMQGWSGHLPAGTLVVNLLGSFVVGLAFVLIIEKELIHPDWRAVLMIGFLSAFTTFSTFSLETIALIEQGHMVTALAYMFGSAVFCVAATGVAIYIARLLL